MAAFPTWAVAAVAGALLSGCAAIIGSGESQVDLRTNPEPSHCRLDGRNAFTLEVDTPAIVTLPSSASPVRVTCSAPGRRNSVGMLDATANGWIWANAGLSVATGGVAILGAFVDESLGAGKSFQKEASFDLEPDHARQIKARSRDGLSDLDLKTR
ncbi:MAG: hypothetical protein ACM31L_03140 [Actinomycetota bacterium]